MLYAFDSIGWLVSLGIVDTAQLLALSLYVQSFSQRPFTAQTTLSCETKRNCLRILSFRQVRLSSLRSSASLMSASLETLRVPTTEVHWTKIVAVTVLPQFPWYPWYSSTANSTLDVPLVRYRPHPLVNWTCRLLPLQSWLSLTNFRKLITFLSLVTQVSQFL